MVSSTATCRPPGRARSGGPRVAATPGVATYASGRIQAGRPGLASAALCRREPSPRGGTVAIGHLRDDDVHRLVDVLDDARHDDPGEAMPWALLEGLQRLVPCDLCVSYQ